MRNATVSPCTACSKSRVTSVSTSAPRRGCCDVAPARRPPLKMPPRMSPSPPAAPAPPARALPSRSPRSKLKPPGAPAPAPPVPGMRKPPLPNSDLASSYSLRVFCIRQHVVGLGDLLELLLGLRAAGIRVGVMHARELAVRLLDLRRASRLSGRRVTCSSPSRCSRGCSSASLPSVLALSLKRRAVKATGRTTRGSGPRRHLRRRYVEIDRQ